MYTGGYVNEFEVIMASSNGDIRQVRWTTFLFWGLMIVMAITGIILQLGNRKTTKEAFNNMEYNNRGIGSAREERAQRLAEALSARGSSRGSHFDDDIEKRPIMAGNQ